jgi:hypothetical protein
VTRRKGNLFLPLDVGFPDDDRIVEAGEKAAWLYICMALAAKRLGTDGVLTARQVDRLHVPGWQNRLAQLLEVELVVSVGEDTYALRAWFQHNDPVAVVEERRRKDAERKRGQRPNGVRADSVRSPSVEKRREEKSTSAAHGQPVDIGSALNDFPVPIVACDLHPTEVARSCRSCAADRKAASA